MGQIFRSQLHIMCYVFTFSKLFPPILNCWIFLKLSSTAVVKSELWGDELQCGGGVVIEWHCKLVRINCFVLHWPTEWFFTLTTNLIILYARHFMFFFLHLIYIAVYVPQSRKEQISNPSGSRPFSTQVVVDSNKLHDEECKTKMLPERKTYSWVIYPVMYTMD